MDMYVLLGGTPEYGLDSPPYIFSTKKAACDFLFERQLEWFADCPYDDEKNRKEWWEDADKMRESIKFVRDNEVEFPYIFGQFDHTLFKLEVDAGLKEMGLK